MSASQYVECEFCFENLAHSTYPVCDACQEAGESIPVMEHDEVDFDLTNV